MAIPNTELKSFRKRQVLDMVTVLSPFLSFVLGRMSVRTWPVSWRLPKHPAYASEA